VNVKEMIAPRRALRLALLVACGTAQAFLLGGAQATGFPSLRRPLFPVAVRLLRLRRVHPRLWQARSAALLPSRERRRHGAAAAFRLRPRPSPAMLRRSFWHKIGTPGPSCASRVHPTVELALGAPRRDQRVPATCLQVFSAEVTDFLREKGLDYASIQQFSTALKTPSATCLRINALAGCV
jgi:hypothetical protein